MSLILGIVLVVPLPARADRSDPHYWIARVADAHLAGERRDKARNIDWLLDALAFTDDQRRLRQVVEDFEDELDELELPEPIAAGNYATVAYGYARLGDAEQYAWAADKATRNAEGIADWLQAGVEIDLLRAAAAIGDLDQVRQRITRAEDPKARQRRHLEVAAVLKRSGDAAAAREFIGESLIASTLIADEKVRNGVVGVVWRLQLECGEIDDAHTTIDEHTAGLHRASSLVYIADVLRHRDPERARKLLSAAVAEAQQSETPPSPDFLAQLLRVTRDEPKLYVAAIALAINAPADPWTVPQIRAYARDIDGCREALETLRPALADPDTEIRATIALEDAARALAIVGEINLAESLVDWTGERHRSDLLRAIGVGHVEAGRLDDALALLDQPQLTGSGRWIVVSAIARELATRGELERLDVLSATLPPDVRSVAYRAAAEELAGVSFVEHFLLLW